jgi:hypothetical protein
VTALLEAHGLGRRFATFAAVDGAELAVEKLLAGLGVTRRMTAVAEEG